MHVLNDGCGASACAARICNTTEQFINEQETQIERLSWQFWLISYDKRVIRERQQGKQRWRRCS